MKTISYNLKTALVKVLAQTEDLKGFKFLVSQNRGVNKTHVNTIKKSFETFGSASATITVVETRSMGSVEHYVADGQHRLTAAIELGLPLNVCVVRLEEDTILNLTKYISVLNNTSKGWVNEGYLRAYANNGIREYQLLLELQRESKLSMSDLLNIFLGNKTSLVADYKNGNLAIPNEADSMLLYKAILKVKPSVPNKAFTRRSLFKIMREVSDYDKMANAIIKTAKLMKMANAKFTENEVEFYEHLTKIKKAAFKK